MARPKKPPVNLVEVRQGIQIAEIIEQLTCHALGTADMKPSQITAALGVLKKALPDYSVMENLEVIESQSRDEKIARAHELLKRYGTGLVGDRSGSATDEEGAG